MKLNMFVRSLPNWRAREMLLVAAFLLLAPVWLVELSRLFAGMWPWSALGSSKLPIAGGCEGGAAEPTLVFWINPRWRSLLWRPTEVDFWFWLP